MLKKSLPMLIFYSKRLIALRKANEFDWMKQNKILMEPFEYVQKLPCKHLKLIPPAFNHWLQVPEDKLDRIDKACRAWVSWGTLLDDIQDVSLYRHGLPATHRIFSVGAAINAAGMTFLQVQREIADLGHPLGPKIFMKRTDEVLYGEGIDIYWRDHSVCPPEEAYVEMTIKKSGSYFVLPVDLMQLFSSNKTDYTDLAIKIGSYYEMLDDYYNLFHPKVQRKVGLSSILIADVADVVALLLQALGRLALKEQENHMTNSDITEGKITLAVIHASQYPDVATELIDIFKQRTSDPELQNRAIILLKKHGSDEYTRNKMRKLEKEIREEIEHLGGNPALTAYMDDLSFDNHEPPPEEPLYS